MANKKAYLYLAGTVYDEQSKGTADYGIITKRQVVDFIKANQDADEFVVTIHSRGGDVSEGFAIYDALRNSGKHIKTIGEGLVASIATVFFLAGDERELTENTDFFIHNPWGEPWAMNGFTADDYQKMADSIRQAEEKILNFYVKKTGADKELLAELMKDETTIPSEKALELKFATKVLETNQTSAKMPKRNYKIAAYLGGFNKQSKNDLNSEEMNKNLKSILDGIKNLGTAIEKMTKGEGEDAGTQNATVEVTLDDGRIMTIEAAGDAPAAGDMVTIDGSAPDDGSYTGEDGTVYAIVGGKIDSITAPADSQDNADDKPTPDAAAQAAKDAKDPVKLNAKINKLSADLKKAQDQLKAAQDAKKKAEDEKTEIENALPAIQKQLDTMAKNFTTLAKSVGSEFEPGERQEDGRREDGGKGKGPKDIADQAVESKIADDKKAQAKKKSLWANQD